MPRLDFLHDTVKQAVINDGWTITHDPFTIQFGARRVYADLGANKFIAAEKSSRKIAIEIKSFMGSSAITELERAIGQYTIYRTWLAKLEKDRELYLALDEDAYNELFLDISGQVLLSEIPLNLIVVDSNTQEVIRWIG